jgi:formate-dependent nitrite reductase membrane component NrfD
LTHHPARDAATGRGYYGVPPLHKPHWKWLIVFYFFFGGIAGAAYAVAAIADAVGAAEDRAIGRAGRYLSLAALLPSPILLILDLGRPERFYLMLRVVKLRSPMSVGTWGLIAFSAFCSLSAAVQAASDRRLGDGALARRLGRFPAGPIGIVGTPAALFVAGYTGVLLAATAVPLWTKRAVLMGPLFLASALSNAVAGITLILAVTPRSLRSTLRRLTRLQTLALIAESAIFATWSEGLGITARPLTEGATGRLVRRGVTGVGVTAPLVIQAVGSVLPDRLARRLTVAASLLVLAGGLALRYAVVVAGGDSADDPASTFDLAGGDDGRVSRLG